MPNTSVELEIVELAHRLADSARQETLSKFRADGYQIDNKRNDSGFDPVTFADRAAEAKMRDILKFTRPSDGVLGEEFGNVDGTSGYTWVLDPIDGTRAFICGAPTWGTLIGVSDQDDIVFGIIDQPHLGERFVGGFGHAALIRSGSASDLKCKDNTNLEQAYLLSTFPEIGTTDERARFENVSRQVKLTRYGLDCYGYGLLSLGTVDLVIEAGLQPYDIAAPIAVVEAAGGIVTDWNGGPANKGGQVIAAANASIHEQALNLLNDY